MSDLLRAQDVYVSFYTAKETVRVLNGFSFSEKRLILCRALQKQQPVVSNGAAKVLAATDEDSFSQKSLQFGLVHRCSSR